jgi:ABC-2 type transport system permease protein
MAVYEHTYQPYAGRLTPLWSRFLVIPQHAYRAVFQSKLFTGLFAICFVCPLIMAIIIYLHHNVNALALFRIQSADIVPINGSFFRVFLMIQSSFAFLLTVLVGPALVSRDLTNNALPLYLCRPFSRAEYVLGKASVLIILLSLITWVPGLLLFIFQSYLEGFGWLTANLWIANAVFVGSVLWIVLLTLFSLALSAWIKWRVAASGALFALLTIPMAIASLISELFRTPWSHLFNPSMLLKFVTDDLFFYDSSSDFDPWMVLPVWAAWIGLAGFVALSLWLLSRKVRAYEVIT